MTAETPLREGHEKAGAPLAIYFDCLLPERFTDPAAESRMARESVALLDMNYRAYIYLEGADRIRYLNAIVSNNIRDLADGQGIVALLLNPQGHILAELECYALADRLLTISHAMVRQRTAETLDKFIIMDDVTLLDATERLGSLAIEGPHAPAVLAALGGPNLEAMAERAHAEANIGQIPCRVLRRSHFGELGAELIADRKTLPALWQTLLGAARARGGGPIGYAALNALRLEAGVPWFSYDFDDKVIPHEAALETTHISFTKGCYTGQEIVERVRSRGHVNRRRVALRFSGRVVPASGTKLLAGDKEAGHVTTAAYSELTGSPIGMGYVRREHTALGSQLQWANGAVEVIELPLARTKASPATPAA